MKVKTKKIPKAHHDLLRALCGLCERFDAQVRGDEILCHDRAKPHDRPTTYLVRFIGYSDASVIRQPDESGTEVFVEGPIREKWAREAKKAVRKRGSK